MILGGLIRLTKQYEGARTPLPLVGGGQRLREAS